MFAGDVVDLLLERRLLVLGRLDPILEPGDLRVDRLLLLDDVGERWRRSREQDQDADDEPAGHQARFGGQPAAPARYSVGGCGSGTITGPGGSCGTGSGSGTITGPGGSLGAGVGLRNRLRLDHARRAALHSCQRDLLGRPALDAL